MLNMLRVVFVLLASCSLLPSHLKTKVEGSSNIAKGQIDAIVKESGFTFDSLQKATGTKGAGDNRIRKVKLKVVEVGEKFLASMKGAIDALGEKGSGAQFSEIYGIILGVAGSMEKIGIQKATDTVKQAAGGKAADSYGKIKNVHESLLKKLQNVKEKQKAALEKSPE
ncbi:DbpA/DbpB family decorin-binding adhesin [Borrelia sp. P9F1]|uniref:DbpA/DbpB family decorin-binding adhesin n=1 Tax=Borrelia sp. P9F1 TaxID=3058374 RepID=UPI002648507F|nr:DbpA/DbpB family decorin-binding adhesin [Borrelia sp. P9F1]WKC58591.1 DbpA/DbpB family decorin-binding adhesin [Borrelia sp. P9F1]